LFCLQSNRTAACQRRLFIQPEPLLLNSPSTSTVESNPGDLYEADAAAQGRRLNEDVLQSAEDAVLSNPDAAAVLVETPAPGVLSRYETALTGYVARRPFQSALMAVAAGAAVAALLRSTLHRRQDSQNL
jgi:hypothetical protein